MYICLWLTPTPLWTISVQQMLSKWSINFDSDYLQATTWHSSKYASLHYSFKQIIWIWIDREKERKRERAREREREREREKMWIRKCIQIKVQLQPIILNTLFILKFCMTAQWNANPIVSEVGSDATASSYQQWPKPQRRLETLNIILRFSGWARNTPKLVSSCCWIK